MSIHLYHPQLNRRPGGGISLEGVPQMPDRLAHIAMRNSVRRHEHAAIAGYIRAGCAEIRRRQIEAARSQRIELEDNDG